MMHWYLEVLRKYAEFSGRSRRREYWFFVLFNFLIMLVLGSVDRALGTGQALGGGLLSAVYSLAVFVPCLAVTARRLHDTNRSGWWMLVMLIPLLGFIWLLILTLLDSHPGGNRFGPNPKEVEAT